MALANATDSLAHALIRTGAGEEAQARQQRAVSLYQRLADDFPSRPEYRRLLSRGWLNLGTLFYKRSDYREADSAFKSAETILSPLVEELPDEPKMRRDLASANRNLGAIRQETGRLADAAIYYDQAVEINETLVNRYPKVPDYRESSGGRALEPGQRAGGDRGARGGRSVAQEKALAAAREPGGATSRCGFLPRVAGRSRLGFKAGYWHRRKLPSHQEARRGSRTGESIDDSRESCLLSRRETWTFRKVWR